MNGEKASILLVDDRPENLLALEAALEPLAHDLVRASSGEEALKRVLTQDFALILLDVQMPGLNGFDTADHIKQREKTRDIPIVFLTAISNEPHHTLRGYSTGAVDYIAKPVDPFLLRAKVNVFVELHQMHQVLRSQRELLALRLDERYLAEEQMVRQAAELERSNHDLEHFAYIASHDLQEPLRLVYGYLELLSGRAAGVLDPDSLDLLDRAAAATERMSALTSALLGYSRVSTQAPEFGRVELSAAVAGALANLEQLVATSGAQADVGELPAVQGDLTQLTQLFQNLVSNAIKFAGDDAPRIRIDAEPDGDCVSVCISDRGLGIDPADAQRVFEMFERTPRHRDRPGTGIGLATCRLIVERHGGRIWVDPRPASGTAVCFTIPGGA